MLDLELEYVCIIIVKVFHSPVDEGPLGVHQVELVVQPGPGLHDGRGVGEAAHGSPHHPAVSPRHRGGRLVVDADLEARGTPVYKLQAARLLHGHDGGIDVLRDDVPAV